MLELNGDRNFKDLMEFPANVKFKFIGTSSGNLEQHIREFFAEIICIEAEISVGSTSKSGKYRTINATTVIPNSEIMYKVYSEGAKIPEVLHVL